MGTTIDKSGTIGDLIGCLRSIDPIVVNSRAQLTRQLHHRGRLGPVACVDDDNIAREGFIPAYERDDEAVALGRVGGAGDEDGFLDHERVPNVEHAPFARLAIVVGNIVIEGKAGTHPLLEGRPVGFGFDNDAHEAVFVLGPHVALVNTRELGVVGAQFLGG
jgi:hypothetical protein